MLYRRPAIWLGAGFCRRRCFFTCLSATPCSFVRLLLHNAPFFLPTHLPFCNVPYFCPPTCLPLWGRWQAERPDGEGAHAVLLDWRFYNTEGGDPLSHRPFGPVPALPEGEPSAWVEGWGVGGRIGRRSMGAPSGVVDGRGVVQKLRFVEGGIKRPRLAGRLSCPKRIEDAPGVSTWGIWLSNRNHTSWAGGRR